jgi:hypothetical protein
VAQAGILDATLGRCVGGPDYQGVNLSEVMRYQPGSDTPDAFDTDS